MSKHFALAAVLIAAWGAAACSKPADDAPPVATPSVTLSRSEVSIGSPLDVTYEFAVAPDAPAFAEDYIVFVHFLDADGELMWTDDHEPPTPTRQWKPGETITYQRTVFVPKFPYVGDARVQVGLYQPTSNVRLPLAGDDAGGRSYRVAAFALALQTGRLFVVFRDGWHDPEVADDGRLEWQWSTKQGVVAFRNPRRDVVAILQVDSPVAAFAEPQRVDLRLGSTVVDSFALASGPAVVRRIPLTAGQLGEGETVEMIIAVDKTFVPASLPALKSGDGRELGIRVFHVHIEPK
jgi:hypothetical protein